MSTFSNTKFLIHVAVTQNFMDFICSVTCSKLKPLFEAFILPNLHLEKVIFKWKSKCAAKGGKGILLSMCPQVNLRKNK